MNSNILQTLADRNSFRFSDFTEACHHYGCTLCDSAIRKRLQDLLKAGEIVRVGHGSYAVARNEHAHYSYIYSEFSEKIVDQIKDAHPYLNFTVFELVQLNEFVNHQIAHNAVFVSVENEVSNFVFETLRELYPGKVLLYPTVETYHQYWSDYKLSKSYTYLNIKATIKVKPMMLTLPLLGDTVKSQLTGTNWYQITYEGTMGY